MSACVLESKTKSITASPALGYRPPRDCETSNAMEAVGLSKASKMTATLETCAHLGTNLEDVKILAEDSEVEPPEPYFALMLAMWRGKFSANSLTAQRELRIYPVPSNFLSELIQRHWVELQHYLPGICDGCQVWALSRVEAYWGSHPHLCLDCNEHAIRYFERHDKWPEPNWYPNE